VLAEYIHMAILGECDVEEALNRTKKDYEKLLE
jgi:hypothetical protein